MKGGRELEEAKKAIIDFLDSQNIEYHIATHERRTTLEEKLEGDKALGIRGCHCKNLFLCDRKKENPVLLVMKFEKTFRTASVSKQLGLSRLSFHSEEILLEKLRCRSGSLSSLCLLFDERHEIRLALDSDLLKEESLCFHPCDDTVTITIKTKDYLEKILHIFKLRPEFVKIEETAE